MPRSTALSLVHLLNLSHDEGQVVGWRWATLLMVAGTGQLLKHLGYAFGGELIVQISLIINLSGHLPVADGISMEFRRFGHRDSMESHWLLGIGHESFV